MVNLAIEHGHRVGTANSHELWAFGTHGRKAVGHIAGTFEVRVCVGFGSQKSGNGVSTLKRMKIQQRQKGPLFLSDQYSSAAFETTGHFGVIMVFMRALSG